MRKKITSIIIATTMTALTLAGCAEADAGDGNAYKVVGGISEPVRVWSSEAGLTAEEASEPGEADSDSSAVAYVPDVLAMEPTLFVTNKPACTYTSDKDGEVVDELEEGAELTLVGTTGKGYYQTEGGAFISASDVERAVEVAMAEEAEAETEKTEETKAKTETTTTQAQPSQQTPTQQEQPAQEQAQPTQQEEQSQQQEQPAQEQVAEQPSSDVQYDSNGEPSDINPVTGGVECEYTPPDAETQAWMDAHADGEVYEVGTYDDGANVETFWD